MMSSDILMVADAVSNEKGVSSSVIFEAIESSLATATKKLHDREEIDCRVAVDRDTGQLRLFAGDPEHGAGEIDPHATEALLHERHQRPSGAAAQIDHHRCRRTAADKMPRKHLLIELEEPIEGEIFVEILGDIARPDILPQPGRNTRRKPVRCSMLACHDRVRLVVDEGPGDHYNSGFIFHP